MIEVEETKSGLYVTDAAKNELHIEMPDWEEGGQEKSINREVDEKIVGTASSMQFPRSAVCVETEGRQEWRTYGNKIEKLEIEDGVHQIQISSNLTIYVRVSGEFIISRNNDNSKIIINYDSSKNLTIGIRSQFQKPTQTIKTSTDPENLATAISHMSIAIETTSPDRSYPSLRNYPPELKLGEDLEIPETVKNKIQRSGIKLKVPEDLEYIFIAAPLAYYLQAELSVNGSNTPKLEVPDEDLIIEFSNDLNFEKEVVNLLRRVFWLDCLVRNEGPFTVDLVEQNLSDKIDLNTKKLYGEEPQARLAEYLKKNFNLIESKFPDWHLATFVEPNEEYIPSIPHLLEKLSIIYKPDSRKVEMSELLDYSLNQFQRSSVDHKTGHSIEYAEPRFADDKHGRVFGWLAEGYPINAYKGYLDSFQNKLNVLDKGNRKKKIVIILNDPKMEEEKSVVAEKYRERSRQLAIDLTVMKNVSIEHLTKIFQDNYDFVHYIGHCTEEGLACNDGFLSCSTIINCKTKTFFLNACGSFEQGRQLILNGSIGGVVTRNRVLNREATRIGSTFANLAIHGFDMEQSLRIASRKSITSHEYFVIGDGTFRLTQGDDLDPSILKIDPKRDSIYEVIDVKNSVRAIGFCQQTDFSEEDEFVLVGNSASVEMDREELIDNLALVNEPVIFDGTYYWSDDLRIKLQN